MNIASAHAIDVRRSRTPPRFETILLLLTGLLGVAGPGVAFAQTPPGGAVAVLDVHVLDVLGFDKTLTEEMTSHLEVVVVNAGMQTVARSVIQQQVAEQKAASYKACYDERCQIELGKAIAAQKTMISAWYRSEKKCVLSVKLIDLKTEVTEFAKEADGTCDRAGLLAAIDQIGEELKVRGQQGYGTFMLDLKEARSTKLVQTDQTGYLRVHAEAQGRPDEKIQVYVDGELAGNVDQGLFTQELPVGHHILHLRTIGDKFEYKRIPFEMTTSGVSLPDRGKVTLQPMFGTLLIYGTPKKATAMIDGEPRDVDNGLREERRVGTYSVVIEAPGYLPYDAGKLKLGPGQEVPVRYKLQRNAGRLTVSGAPAGAQVLLEGHEVCTVPCDLDGVDVGDHVLEVAAPGFHAEKKVVRVRRGATADVAVELQEEIARLKIEAVAQVLGRRSPVEAEVIVDGASVGMTPWKGSVRAEVSHSVVLRLGRSDGPSRRVSIAAGEEHREVIDVPASWGGAVSSVQFKLVPGPWEVRSGDTVLSLQAPNELRPGRVPLELLLDGKKVAEVAPVLSPDEARVITVTARPRTDEELGTRMTAWEWRKWGTLVAAIASGGAGTAFMLKAHQAQAARDTALATFNATTDPGIYDTSRGQVIAQENARSRDQLLGLSCLGAAVGLAAWSGIEWFFAEPQRGDLVLTGVGEVP